MQRTLQRPEPAVQAHHLAGSVKAPSRTISMAVITGEPGGRKVERAYFSTGQPSGVLEARARKMTGAGHLERGQVGPPIEAHITAHQVLLDSHVAPGAFAAKARVGEPERSDDLQASKVTAPGQLRLGEAQVGLEAGRRSLEVCNLQLAGVDSAGGAQVAQIQTTGYLQATQIARPADRDVPRVEVALEASAGRAEGTVDVGGHQSGVALDPRAVQAQRSQRRLPARPARTGLQQLLQVADVEVVAASVELAVAEHLEMAVLPQQMHEAQVASACPCAATSCPRADRPPIGPERIRRHHRGGTVGHALE